MSELSKLAIDYHRARTGNLALTLLTRPQFLTVVSFRNSHLTYALTWFGLAVMLAGWSIYLVRQESLSRRKLLDHSGR